MKKLMSIIVIVTMVAGLAACSNNKNSDNFDASNFIVSSDSVVKDGDLIITVVIKDEWEYEPARKRNEIRDKVNSQIEAQENSHKNDDNINRQTFIIKTESGESADMWPDDMSNTINVEGISRGMDEFIIMIDDQLYYGTTEKGKLDKTKTIVGEITSYTDDDAIPTDNGQANMNITGIEYTDGGRFAQVKLSDEWFYFYPEIRKYKVFSEDEKIIDSLDSINSDSVEDIKDTIGKTALSLYNSDKYGISKKEKKVFLMAVEIKDYNKVDDKLQIFVDIQGDGYAVFDDYIENTHGFGQRYYYIFKKNSDNNYVFESAQAYGKFQGEEESKREFCTSPLDNKFLSKTYNKLFVDEQSEKINDVSVQMLTTYTKSIGKDNLEVRN